MPGGELIQNTSAVASPLDTTVRVYERADAIWLADPPAPPLKLTADDDLAVLRTRQREGEVILYWSTQPVWSADGRRIAFVTNRESVRGGHARQSIWVIDVATRTQRPLVADSGDAVRTEGVFGDEFLFTSSLRPGVLAVDPVTGKARQVGDGFVLTADPRGRAVAIAEDNGSRTVRLLSRTNDVRVEAPRSGFTWSTQASFSPSANRVALVATDGAGAYELFALDTDGKVLASIAMPGGPTTIPRWVSEDELVFSASRPREQIRNWAARLTK